MIAVSKLLVAPLIGFGFLTVGCQSPNSSTISKNAGQNTDPVVLTCSKCQTNYAKVPVIGGDSRTAYRIVRYKTVDDHQCPDCTNIVKTWVKLGKSSIPGQVIHSCKSCGGEVEVCHKEEL
ncbi:MAG: hypothetical protein KatS3mg104_1777 [Phycisphaerae bacterium]|jgi:hypothetical protein|nr:MAG: hypothetical protein KatS3mg104_1777 [Phycisphaerae bacterium]